MPEEITQIAKDFVNKTKRITGASFVKAILYGSYARGEQKENSDIDILVLVTLPEGEIKDIENEIYDVAFEIELETGRDITPIIKNQKQFEYWCEALPFYRNISREGVVFA